MFRLALVSRVRLTTALVVLILVLSVVTRALWDPLATRPLSASTTYGLPALEAGSWWTTVTGAFFALKPLQYLPILGGLALFGGFAEWRLGPRRAAAALASTHLLAVLGAALFLWITRDHGYAWATTLSHQRDAGPSAGFLGAAAVASVTLSSPWRGRLRAALAAYVLLFLLHLGALADLEHVIGVGSGLLLGPVLMGRAPRLGLRPLTRRDFRLLGCSFFVLAALEGLIQPFANADGPLSSTLSTAARLEELQSRQFLGAAVQAVLWFWFARSLYKGRRRAWHWAIGILGLVTATQVVGAVLMVVAGEPGLPVALYELLGNSLGLVVLWVGRRAFRNPSPRRARRTTGSLVAPAG